MSHIKPHEDKAASQQLQCPWCVPSISTTAWTPREVTQASSAWGAVLEGKDCTPTGFFIHCHLNWKQLLFFSGRYVCSIISRGGAQEERADGDWHQSTTACSDATDHQPFLLGWVLDMAACIQALRKSCRNYWQVKSVAQRESKVRPCQGMKLSGRGHMGNQTSFPHAVEKSAFPVLCT